MLDNLHCEDFAPHLDTNFQMQLGELIKEIELIGVEDKSPSPRQEQFVLTFRAPHDAPPQQGIYQLEHASLGSGALFLVPIGRDQSGLTYEAIFNRQRNEPQ